MKSSRETIVIRRNKVLDLLSQKDVISVSELTKTLQVSEITVRRDLDYLEQQGIILRYFGGARLVRENTVPAKKENPAVISDQRKKAIAQHMADLIEDNDTVFMNSSSTACMVVSYIRAKNVTIVTNNAKSILQQRSSEITLLLTGGEVSANKSSLTGAYALDAIQKVTCSKCIIGVSGISAKNGITTSILPETTINHAMIEHCPGSIYVLADSSKIGIVHNFYSGPVSDIDYLITDCDANQEQLRMLSEAGVQSLLVNY